MDTQNKKTALKDDSALYQHNTDKLTDKEKFQSLTGKQKWQQFKDYYLAKVLAVLAIVGFAIALLHSILKPKAETVMYAAVCDGAISPETCKQLEEDFTAYLGLDTVKEQVLLDNTFYFSSGDINIENKFMVYNFAGDISVCIAPMSQFEKLAGRNVFAPLAEVLPTESYTGVYADRLVLCGINDENGKTIADSEKAFGILLTGSQYLEDSYITEPVVIAIMAHCNNLENSRKFIEYLLK